MKSQAFDQGVDFVHRVGADLAEYLFKRPENSLVIDR